MPGDRQRPTSLVVAACLIFMLVMPMLRGYLPGLSVVAYIVPVGVMSGLAVAAAMTGCLRLSWEAMGYPVSILALVAWLFVSSAWTISSGQYLDDAVHLVVIVVLVLATVLLVDVRTAALFFSLFAVCSLLAGFLAVSEFVLAGNLETAGTRLKEIYLTVANVIGAATTGVLVRVLVADRISGRWLILGLLLLAQLALSLARGALLTTLGLTTLAAVIAAGVRAHRGGFSGSVVGGARLGMILAILGGGLMVGLQVERTRMRLLRIFGGEELEQGGRGEIWANAIAGIKNSPWFGHGMSANGLMSRGDDLGYPHNLVLQAWLDGGLLAALLLGVVVAWPLMFGLRRLLTARGQQRLLIAVLMAIYLFQILEFGKSGNFYAARAFFVFGAVLVAATRQPTDASGSPS